MKYMKKLLAITMALVLCLSLAACQTTTTNAVTTIKVGVMKAPAYALLQIADAKGYFKDENLNIDWNYVGSGSLAMSALLDGSVDMSTIPEISVANLGYTGNTSLSYIAGLTHNMANAIVAKKSAGINSPSDLKGKKIAYAPGTTMEVLLRRTLAKYNIGFDEIEPVTLQPNTMTSAMVSGNVDAIVSYEPILYNTVNALGDDAIEFKDSDVYNGFGLVGVNNTFAQNNEKAVVGFLTAIKKAKDFADNNQDEAQQIVATAVDMDIDTIKTIWGNYGFDLFLDDSISSEIEKEGGELNAVGAQDEGNPLPDYSVYYNDKYIKEVK